MNLNRFQIEMNADLAWRLFLSFSIIAVIFISSGNSFAGGGKGNKNNNSTTSTDVIGDTLCRLANNLNGGIAKGIATIAIFSVGVGLFLGKINWGVAAATAAGVGIIFSSGTLVDFIAGDGSGSSDECLKET